MRKCGIKLQEKREEYHRGNRIKAPWQVGAWCVLGTQRTAQLLESTGEHCGRGDGQRTGHTGYFSSQVKGFAF